MKQITQTIGQKRVILPQLQAQIRDLCYFGSHFGRHLELHKILQNARQAPSGFLQGSFLAFKRSHEHNYRQYLKVITIKYCLWFCSWARLKAKNKPYKNPLGAYLAFLRILCNSRWRPKWLPKYKDLLFELVTVVESPFFGLLSVQCVSHDRLENFLECEMYIYAQDSRWLPKWLPKWSKQTIFDGYDLQILSIVMFMGSFES